MAMAAHSTISRQWRSITSINAKLSGITGDLAAVRHRTAFISQNIQKYSHKFPDGGVFSVKAQFYIPRRNLMRSHFLYLVRRSSVLILCTAFVLVFVSGASAFVEEVTEFEGMVEVEPLIIEGEWTAQLSSKDGSRIQLSFTRRSEKGGHSQNSNSFKLADLQGMSSDLLAAARTDVSFRLAREAGTISC